MHSTNFEPVFPPDWDPDELEEIEEDYELDGIPRRL